MKLKTISTFLLTFSLGTVAIAQQSVVQLPLEILQISDDPNIKSSVLLADKTERKLYFFDSEENLKSPTAFEIDIGKSDGNKTKRNDKKTPEGIYLLQKKMTQPEIPFDLYGSLAFTTDYPNVFDKFENKTGDGIWLHSVPDTVPLNRGSKGCVVLRNDNIKLLSDKISLNKSHLIINAKTNWLPAEEHLKKQTVVKQWFETWLKTWESQNLKDYIELYSNDFSAPAKFDKSKWLKHKEKLKEIYKDVKISASKPSIFHLKNQYIVKFVQDYSSDKHKDTGIKTLYLIEENNTIKVLREEWSELPSANASL
jgi:murein L,D-transpeptidase YafK